MKRTLVKTHANKSVRSIKASTTIDDAYDILDQLRDYGVSDGTIVRYFLKWLSADDAAECLSDLLEEVEDGNY